VLPVAPVAPVEVLLESEHAATRKNAASPITILRIS
jgi:hypothetical protein